MLLARELHRTKSSDWPSKIAFQRQAGCPVTYKGVQFDDSTDYRRPQQSVHQTRCPPPSIQWLLGVDC